MANVDHELKCVQPFFDAVWYGSKTADLRHNDRNFRVGDVCLLREYDDDNRCYHDRTITFTISHILGPFDVTYGPQPPAPMVVLSMQSIRRDGGPLGPCQVVGCTNVAIFTCAACGDKCCQEHTFNGTGTDGRNACPDCMPQETRESQW